MFTLFVVLAIGIFLLIIIKILVCCMDCRTFVALRYERWFALWLLDQTAEQFGEPYLAESLSIAVMPITLCSYGS